MEKGFAIPSPIASDTHHTRQWPRPSQHPPKAPDRFRIVLHCLQNQEGCAHYITASVALMNYGEPCLTNDVDVVLAIDVSLNLNAEYQSALARTSFP